jgi:alkanesulfonate monooxygenase SsuD/methylene tetrahydromethanopterin reductase-like flavin-dependent oxidoreductase (luciferase family)
MDLGDPRWTVDALAEYVQTATTLGFEAVCANDHLVFGTPWLDGPTALAAVAACSGTARLVTTVANPVVRGPAAVAKSLAALDVLSGGRVLAGLGPGSSARDYECVGVPFEERWARFDDAVPAVRSLLAGTRYDGRHYRCDERLEPLPVQPGGVPLWVASWGSDHGLRRTARLGDGWLASAYNTTPEAFGRAWRSLLERLHSSGRPAAGFANGLATMWYHVDTRHADAVLRRRLVPVVHRPADQLRDRLAFGSPTEVADRLGAFSEAGAQWVFVWPVADELEQLHRFADVVQVLRG